MKINSLRYLSKEGVRNIVTNKLMSFASVMVLLSCLLIIGVALLIFSNMDALLEGFDSQNIVMVFIDDEASGEEEAALGERLNKIENIASVIYVSREEAFEDMKNSASTISDIMDNLVDPDGQVSFLPNAFKITMKDLSLYDDTLREINLLDNVYRIRNNSEMADTLVTIRNAVTNVSIGVIIILFFVAVFIIANTIRITMFSRKLEISIMKAVGATRWFIRWPFLIEGIILGVISALFSFGVIYVLYGFALRSPDSLSEIFGMLGGEIVPFNNVAVTLIAVFMLIGVFTGSFGSFISMSKYLKEQGSVLDHENEAF